MQNPTKKTTNTGHIDRATDREVNCPKWFPQVLTFSLPGWVCYWGCEQHLAGLQKSTLEPAWSEAPGSDVPHWSLLPWPHLEPSAAPSALTGVPHALLHTWQGRAEKGLYFRITRTEITNPHRPTMPMCGTIIPVIKNAHQILQKNIIARLPSCTDTTEYIYMNHDDTVTLRMWLIGNILRSSLSAG